MKKKSDGWNVKVNLNFCEKGGHCILTNHKGKELEYMLSSECVAYLGAILEEAMNHAVCLIGDEEKFYDVPSDDKTN